jgi:eukaryotic-like serine/threonine-protein kinase
MVENIVKLKKFKTIGLVLLLIVSILSLGIFGFSCISGISPIGWSGGTVSNNTLYVGSLEGRLVAVNLADQSRQWAEPLKLQSQGGLFGCSSMLSCGGTTSRAPIYGTPVVSANLVYLAGYNGKIYAYNTTNLASRWIFPRDGYLSTFVGSLIIDQNKLYIGCTDGWIYCLDATTGDLLSKYQTGAKIWGTPAVAGNTVYIGSFDKKLYALDSANLTLKWTYTTEGAIIAKPLVNNGVVYIGSFDKKMYAINAADGTLKWQYDQAGNWFWTQPVIVDGMLYAGCLDGFIYVLDAETGAVITVFDNEELTLVSPFASQPVAIGNYIIFASQNGIIYKIDTVAQTIKQIAAITGTITGPLTAYQGNIYFQTQDIAIQCINIENGAVTSIPLTSG